MTHWKKFAAMLALVPVPAVAQADQPESGADGDIVIADLAVRSDIVVTATGFETERNSAGQAITLITAEQLERKQSLTLIDAMQSVPSVSIATRGGYGSQSSGFIRGGNSAQTLVLIDGVRVNDPSSPNNLFDFGGLTVGNIDQIEVLRGPNSVVWGSQAIGGVISIRTAEPADGLSIRARAEYGSYDTASAATNVSGKFGIVSASVGGSFFSSDGISSLRAGTERDGFRNAALNAKLKITFSDAVSVDLKGFYNRSRVQYDAAFSATPDTLSESRDRNWTGYAGLNIALADGTFRNRLSYARTDVKREGTDPATPVLFSNYNIFAYAGQLDRFEYQGVFDAAEALTLIAGAEHERSRASNFFPANGGTTPDRAKTNATSFFGQAVFRPLTGLTATLGLRHDDFARYGRELSLGGNIAYSPNGGATVLRATYAEGFRAPSLTEALLPFGNPALEAETARSFDLGIEQKLLDDRLRASATWFRRTSRNQITFDFVTFQSQNVERVRASGLEMELEMKPSDRLILAAHYSLTNVRDRSPGATFDKRLERRPQHMAGVSVDWTSPFGLALGGTLSLRGDSFENRANTILLDGFAVAGIRASYPITDAISLYGRVENLFDAAYETVSGYGSLGRNAHIGVRARF